jgi:hypothetical protein
MNKFKGTPGPWTVTQDGDFLYQCKIKSDYSPAPIGLVYGGLNDVENGKNAMLIATAPELLESCLEMLEEMQVWESEQGEHPAATKARLAIYKALGND